MPGVLRRAVDPIFGQAAADAADGMGGTLKLRVLEIDD